MDVSFKDVSLEDIKQQLLLLGHDVPDDLVAAYLREVQEQSQESSSRVISVDVPQAGSNLNSARTELETTETVPAHSIQHHIPGLEVSEASQRVAASSVDRRGPDVSYHRGLTGAEVHSIAGSISDSELLTDELKPREQANTATDSTPISPSHRLNRSDQSNGDCMDTSSQANTFHPDHLLPADVLQRARSIINEHLAEHQMPPVDSLSEFVLNDAPQPEACHKRAGPSQIVHSFAPSPRSRDKSIIGTKDAIQESLTHEAHKIPHTAAGATRNLTTQKARPSTAKRPSTAPNRKPRTFMPSSGVDDYENDDHGPNEIDDLMVQLRKGATSRRSALESLEGSLFNCELGSSHSDERGRTNTHAKRRPATASGQCNKPCGSSQDAGVGVHPYMRRYSHHGMGGDCGKEFDHCVGRATTRVSSPERPLLRPKVNLNSSFLTGRSSLCGQARKVDRVARYQQLSKQWSRDPFLSATSRRRNQGFQEAFTAAHERSQADLNATKAINASGRPQTAGRRPYVPPGEKRRDRLRWDVRTRMQMPADL